MGWTFASGTAISSACVPSMCSPTTVIVFAVLEPRVDDDALAGIGANPGAVGAEDARLRHRRQALSDPEVEVVQRRRAQLDEDFACARDGIRRVLVAEHLRSAVLVDANCLHRRGTLPG